MCRRRSMLWTAMIRGELLVVAAKVVPYAGKLLRMFVASVRPPAYS